MNRQLQQMLGLWISYGSSNQEKREGQQQKHEIIKIKEKNGLELQKIVTIYISRVLAIAEIDKDTYQLMMLCKDYQGMHEVLFSFREL